MTLSDYYDRPAVARVVIPRCPWRFDKGRRRRGRFGHSGSRKYWP